MPDQPLPYAAYHPQVLGYLTRMLGHRETAQDLAQETFLRAARAGGPEDGSHKRAWIFRIARNVALNHLRDTTRHIALAPETGRADTGATQETALLVHEALAQLAPLDRDIFLLRESAGLGYDEIAATCGVTPDAVRSRLQRARQALRVLLAGTLETSRARGVRMTGRNDT